MWLPGEVERTARAPGRTCLLCQRVKRKRCLRLWTELWARTSWSPTPAATWPPRCPRLGPSSRATWRWSCRCSWWLWSSWWWPGTRWSSWLLLWIKPWEIKATTSSSTLPYLIFSSVSPVPPPPPLLLLLHLLLLLLLYLSVCSVNALKFGPFSFVPSCEWKPTRSLFAHAPPHIVISPHNHFSRSLLWNWRVHDTWCIRALRFHGVLCKKTNKNKKKRAASLYFTPKKGIPDLSVRSRCITPSSVGCFCSLESVSLDLCRGLC